jgi:hypothetical protein
MESRSSKFQPQGVCVDPGQGRDRHRRIAEQEPEHAGAGDLVAAQGHARDEDRAAPFQVPDHDAESLVRPGDGDLVGLLHGLEGGDVHPLPEGPDHVPLGGGSLRVEHVLRPLPPRSVGDLGDHAVKAALLVMEEEKRDRVEPDAEVARVGQQPDRASRSPPQTGLHEVAGAQRQGPLAARKVVGLPETRRSRAARRPERDRVEDAGELVEIEQRHEDAVAEGVGDGAEAAMRHPPLVDRGARHAASASSSGTGPLRCVTDTTSPACGIGPRPPSLSDTRSADQTPSSWKPQRQ